MTQPPRNILTVIAAPHWGGLHVVVERTTPHFAEAGYRRFVALPSPDPAMRMRLEAAGCAVVPLSLNRLRKTINPLTHLRFAKNFKAEVDAITRIANENSIDIVEVAGLLNLQPVFAALRSRLPLVWQLHSTLAPAPLRHGLGRFAASRADVVMTSGEGMAARHGGLRQVLSEVVPFCAPISVTEFRPDPAARSRVRAELGYTDDDIVVGTLGNRGWQKRHEFILEIADRLRGHPLRFAIAGTSVDTNDSYYREAVIRPLSTRGLARSVSIVEQRHSAADLMNAFDVFLLPSRAEGASLVTAEAMATGLPIVASDVGSLPDIVGPDNGFLCPVDSVDAFCAALISLKDPGLRKRLGAASRQRAVSKLGEERCAESHFDAYRRALDKRTRC